MAARALTGSAATAATTRYRRPRQRPARRLQGQRQARRWRRRRRAQRLLRRRPTDRRRRATTRWTPTNTRSLPPTSSTAARASTPSTATTPRASATSDLPQGLSFTFAGGADDGRPGEGDDIRNVERLKLSESARFVGTEGADYVKVAQATNAGELIGNGGDDDLNGADGPEKLDGGPGNDKLDGGFGDDTITGGPGQDKISGDLAGGDCGPLWCKYPYGNDTIYAQDGEVDSILCGFGTDTVYADAADVVDKDCESVTRAGASSAAVRRRPVARPPTTPARAAVPRPPWPGASASRRR